MTEENNNMINDEWVSVSEAAALCNRKEGIIRQWYRDGLVDGFGKPLKVKKRDLMKKINPFGSVFPKECESFRPIYSLKQGRIEFLKSAIMVGNKGSILNVKTGRIYAPNATDTNGHIQYAVNGIQFYPHRIIAMTWCQNRRFKQIVHHIDSDKMNNAADNLIWVTTMEHLNLHRLIKEDYNKYLREIKKIKIQNKYKGETLYPIINEEMTNKKYIVVYMTNYEGYCIMLNGGTIQELISRKLLKIEYGTRNEAGL